MLSMYGFGSTFSNKTSSALDIQYPRTTHKKEENNEFIVFNHRNNKQQSPKYSSNSFCIECSRTSKSTTEEIIGPSNGLKVKKCRKNRCFFQILVSLLTQKLFFLKFVCALSIMIIHCPYEQTSILRSKHVHSICHYITIIISYFSWLFTVTSHICYRIHAIKYRVERRVVDRRQMAFSFKSFLFMPIADISISDLLSLK